MWRQARSDKVKILTRNGENLHRTWLYSKNMFMAYFSLFFPASMEMRRTYWYCYLYLQHYHSILCSLYLLIKARESVVSAIYWNANELSETVSNFKWKNVTINFIVYDHTAGNANRLRHCLIIGINYWNNRNDRQTNPGSYWRKYCQT